MAMIFKINNKITKKSLIGVTTKDAPFALKSWMKNCRRQNFADYDISQDYKQYGQDSFEIEVLDIVEKNGEAQEVADNFIDEYNTLQPNGYNKSYLGIRKRTPDYYSKFRPHEEEVVVSIDDEITVGEKIRLENEMKNIYGLDELVEPSMKKNLGTKQTVEGLRRLADDLEKYGNIKVLSVIPKDLNDEIEKNGKGISQILRRRKLLNPDKEYTIFPSDTILCLRCGKYKTKDVDFYSHLDKAATYDGYIHICKDCLADYSEQIYNVCKNALFTIISIAQLSNIVFIQEMAEKAVNNWENHHDNPREIGRYYFTELKSVWARRKEVPQSMLEFRNSNFVGDIFSFEEHHPAMPKVFIKELNQGLVKEKIKGDKTLIENMESKWGKGFKADDYEALEEEFTKLEKFLPKKTELHIEALKKYVIYGYKEKRALADGKDLKEVKEWSSLADKAAENAQLKIKQLSADFGDGVDSFAQLAETVEEYYSAIPVLPKVRKMPYDDMDFLIWQIVNYIRRLEGKPETSYEEVYNFYDEELTKKMRDSGMTEDQILKAKDERNAVFKDLSDAYVEPLWLLPVLDSDEDEDDEGGGL